MIQWLKTKIISYAFKNMITEFVINDNDELVEIHLSTGQILCTQKDNVKTQVDNFIYQNTITFCPHCGKGIMKQS